MVAVAFALVIAQAQPVVQSGAAAQVLKAKTTVDAVSKATKKTKKKSSSTKKKKASPTPQPTMDMPEVSMTPVEDLTVAEDPMYPVGAEVVIIADHMPGMMGAKGVVSGAFDTTLYAVDYTTADGKDVINHRWVISEEIEGSEGMTFAVGDTVTLGRGHMESWEAPDRARSSRRLSKARPTWWITIPPTAAPAWSTTSGSRNLTRKRRFRPISAPGNRIIPQSARAGARADCAPQNGNNGAVFG
jgi:hypothetical protein